MIWWLVIGAALGGEPVEVWVDVPDAATADTVRTLGLGYAEGRQGTRLRMAAWPEMLDGLDRAGVAWTAAPAAAAPEGYHDPDELRAALDDLAASRPDLVQVVDLGASVEGRPIVGVRISATDQPQARWRILGAHHGDEACSSEVATSVRLTGMP